jgi:hypothetical protein
MPRRAQADLAPDSRAAVSREVSAKWIVSHLFASRYPQISSMVSHIDPAPMTVVHGGVAIRMGTVQSASAPVFT